MVGGGFGGAGGMAELHGLGGLFLPKQFHDSMHKPRLIFQSCSLGRTAMVRRVSSPARAHTGHSAVSNSLLLSGGKAAFVSLWKPGSFPQAAPGAAPRDQDEAGRGNNSRTQKGGV